MQELKSQCPFCGFSFLTEESSAGIVTTCANCSKDFKIEVTNGPVREINSNAIRPDQINVTSGDLRSPYEVVGMTCFTIGTRGQMKVGFESLKTDMAFKIEKSKNQFSKSYGAGQFIGGIGLDSGGDVSLAGLYASATFDSKDLEIAFHIAVNQLQLRASYINANAIIAFRYDVDFDSNAGILNFVATAYGTAVQLNT